MDIHIKLEVVGGMGGGGDTEARRIHQAIRRTVAFESLAPMSMSPAPPGLPTYNKTSAHMKRTVTHTCRTVTARTTIVSRATTPAATMKPDGLTPWQVVSRAVSDGDARVKNDHGDGEEHDHAAVVVDGAACQRQAEIHDQT
jgi:hypothetical protein